MHHFTEPLSHTACTLILALGLGTSALAQDTQSAIGQEIRPFVLKTADGIAWDLRQSAVRQFTVVAFLGVECPLVKLYAKRLGELQHKYADKITFVGINSNAHDSITELQHFVRTQALPFDVLKDPGNVVADQFGAKRTPEVFLLGANHEVIYHGCIDDQYSYGVQKPAADHEYLRDAIEAVLQNQPVETPATEVLGCIIGRQRSPDENANVTYANQISRILQNHCVRCHRAGEICAV